MRKHPTALLLCLTVFLLLASAGSLKAAQLPPWIRKLQAEQEEQLKKDPELYRKVKAMRERAESIRAILEVYQGGKLSRAEAEQRLAPLIREDALAELPSLQGRIKKMESELEFLRKASKDPDLLVRRRLDQMLQPPGPRKTPPEPPDASGGM